MIKAFICLTRRKYNFYLLLFLLFGLVSCFQKSNSQTADKIFRITNYCDSIGTLENIEIVTKTGESVTLDFKFSADEIVQITEQTLGYKNFYSTVDYFLSNNKLVFVNADIEISTEEGDTLTIELHKIYFDEKGIIEHLISSQSFHAESLYSEGSDPTQTAADIRNNARFIIKNNDPEFERRLLQTVEDYIEAGDLEEEDPLFNQLISPFI